MSCDVISVEQYSKPFVYLYVLIFF